MIDVFRQVSNFISGLTAENVAFISVSTTLITTFIIFILGKRKENKLKIYEVRIEQYKKLITFIETVAKNSKTPETLKNAITDEMLLSLGTSLAIFGSKKLYKTYCLYRWVGNNEDILKTNGVYPNDFMIFIIGDMFRIMRKEIGTLKFRKDTSAPEMLSFFVPGITSSDFMKRLYNYRFGMFKLKFFIVGEKISGKLPFAWVYYHILKPIGYILLILIYLLLIKPYKRIKKRNGSLMVQPKDEGDNNEVQSCRRN